MILDSLIFILLVLLAGIIYDDIYLVFVITPKDAKCTLWEQCVKYFRYMLDHHSPRQGIIFLWYFISVVLFMRFPDKFYQHRSQDNIMFFLLCTVTIRCMLYVFLFSCLLGLQVLFYGSSQPWVFFWWSCIGCQR